MVITIGTDFDNIIMTGHISHLIIHTKDSIPTTLGEIFKLGIITSDFNS